jgi:hypothetical protein
MRPCPTASTPCSDLSEEDKKMLRAEPAGGPGQDCLAGVAQIQTGNRLNYQPTTQVESLSHLRSSWRKEQALGLLHRSDGVPAGASQRDAPRAQGNGYVPTHRDQGDL